MNGPGIHIPPPLFYVASFAAGLLVDKRIPLRLLPEPLRTTGRGIAVTLAAAGVLLFLWAGRRFAAADTTVMPNRAATSLVTGGPFRWSRNPIYLSFFALYLALALQRNSAWPLLFAPLTFAALQFWIVPREERHLASRFGADYDAYRGRVRRWL